MTLTITRAEVDALGFDLDNAIAAFEAAKEAHRLTVDVPAPTAHPLVEEIIRRGGYEIEEPEPEPEPGIPDRVTSRQFKMQLEIAGLSASVESWVSAQTKLVQIAYANSGTFVRSEPMLQAGFAALGFTTEEGDEFFTAAAAL